jgi:hypothetical protein
MVKKGMSVILLIASFVCLVTYFITKDQALWIAYWGLLCLTEITNMNGKIDMLMEYFFEDDEDEDEGEDDIEEEN